MEEELREAFGAAIERHHDDGHGDELMLGYDPTIKATPWFVVRERCPMDAITFGKTAVDALRAYADEGAL